MSMYIPPTIRLSFGPAALPHRPIIRVSVTAHELHQLARVVERNAENARAEGNAQAADTLDWRAAALREATR